MSEKLIRLFAADRYEGEWRNGLENGVGTFIGADGSTFYGPWSGGKMHGQIVRPLLVTLQLHLFAVQSEEIRHT